MTVFAQLLLFLSSYAPLFLVFGLLDSFGGGVSTGVCLAAAGLGVASPFLVVGSSLRVQPQDLKIESVQPRDSDLVGYVATFLVPFAAVSATTGRERAALIVFVVLLAVLYARAQLFYVNPLLGLGGYRLFQVVSPHGASVVLISRRRFVSAGSTISARRLGDYVYWEK